MNMIVIQFIIISFLVIYGVNGDSVFVSLKDNESFEEFYSSDLKYPEDLRVRDHIASTFSIGKFKGFVGDFTKKMVDRLSKCPYVSEVTPNIVVNAFETTVQSDPPRHLGRISQRKRLKKDYSFVYDTNASGLNVMVYIIDSGIEIGHPEFQGRAKEGKDLTREGTGDKNGHGTHVAGLIGSKTYGVAKKVDIIEVKALSNDGSGSLSTIIAALEYAVNHRLTANKPGVANLSLGAAKNPILNKAIDAAVDSGLVIVVAAGNSNINSCKTSPGSAINAITVGSIDDKTDAMTPFSNWGDCVDILAPGVQIQSVDLQQVDSPKSLTGTSMSAPIVTGIAANLLSAGIKPKNVKKVIIAMATDGKVKRTSLFLKGNTPNRIAYLSINSLDTDSDSDYDSDYDSD